MNRFVKITQSIWRKFYKFYYFDTISTLANCSSSNPGAVVVTSVFDIGVVVVGGASQPEQKEQWFIEQLQFIHVIFKMQSHM